VSRDRGEKIVALERVEIAVGGGGHVAVRGTSRSSAISPK
jgi:hypothetical protein